MHTWIKAPDNLSGAFLILKNEHYQPNNEATTDMKSRNVFNFNKVVIARSKELVKFGAFYIGLDMNYLPKKIMRPMHLQNKEIYNNQIFCF